MDDIKPNLMQFVTGEDFFEKILVVESEAYLEQVRERFPTAEIFFVTTDEDFHSNDAEVFLLDYREERLPFEKNFFDAIIGDLTLEVVTNAQDIAKGFSAYIKETGCWLTSFRNVRHWKNLEKLMRGTFGAIVSRLYARTDFERLLYASFYKDVKTFPLKKNAPPELLERLITCGFDNFDDDLQTEFWLVRANRSMPEIALLKSMFTSEVRADLSRILHRIEYDIAAEENVQNFWRLFDTEGIFADYAAAFIRSVVVHRENFYSNLRQFSARSETEKIIAEAESFYDFDNGDRLR